MWGDGVAKYGKSSSGRDRTDTEVFTPDWLVKDMCNMLEQESADAFESHKTFLEPTCGDGNFIAEVLRRKFERCVMRQDFTVALKSVYGMDIQADNIAECIRRVTVLCENYFRPTKEELQIINDHYIMCDSLKIMRMMADENLQSSRTEGKVRVVQGTTHLHRV